MDKCRELNYYITTFDELPSIKDYIIFIDKNISDIQFFINKKIIDLINETYQNNLKRSPTDQEYKNIMDLFRESKINKKNFIDSILQSSEFIKIQSTKHIQNITYEKSKYSYIDINKFVDKIYLINLERRQDRFKKIYNKLSKFNIKFERFSAIDGSKIGVRDEWIQLLENGSKISSPGAYGCLMSHLQIIKQAKQNKFSKILIFEDDIIFHKEFNNELRKINNVPHDASIIYLGASQFKSANKNFINSSCYKAFDTFGTFAYIIKDSMYDILIDIFEKKQYDLDYLLCVIQKHFSCYVLWENIIIADLSYSDIRTEKHTYETFGWNISKYDLEGTMIPDIVTDNRQFIGLKVVNDINDALLDIENTKNINLEPGYSFLIRAKNEEVLVKNCIESIVDIADEIIFVDNGSSDSTFEKITHLANIYNNIYIYQYNINVPKAGKLHEQAVESGSMNTLATYYNWCLSKVTKYNVIKWDCDFIGIKENLTKMILQLDLKSRDDKFGVWFTGKTLFYGKYLRETDYYDEFRIFSKKNGFKWDNYKGCETSAYYNWSLDKAYIHGITKPFSDIRFKNLDKFKNLSPPIFFEIKAKNDIKISTNILDTRDNKDNDILLRLQLSNEILLKNLASIRNKNYKLLITVPSLTVGGGNLWTINIYRALIELGFDVKIYCNFISKNPSDNVYIDHFDQQDILCDMPSEKVYNYIIDNKISYVIQTTPLLTDIHLSKLNGKVFTAVLTHSDVSYINNYIQRNNKLLSKIITVNNKTIRKFADFGIKNSLFLPNYITDIEYNKNKEITKQFGIISRLSTDKNILMTLFAFNEFIKFDHYKDYTLHIVGDDSEKTMNQIRYYINKLNLSNNVILHGYQKNVIDYYNAMDAIILPSVSEGCPYNLLEAALTGTPIICSNVGGNKEIVGDYAITFDLEGAELISKNNLYINSYNDHLENIGYKINSKNDGILVPEEFEIYDLVPACNCMSGNNSKLNELIKKWNKNVSNIVTAFMKMADNYDYYIQMREKLFDDVKSRFSSKRIFVNHLIKILDLDFEMI